MYAPVWGGVAWKAPVITIQCTGAEGPVMTLMWVGILGRGTGIMGLRQLQVSAHLCSDLLSLDAGISVWPPSLLSNTHLLCDNGPVLPSFWTSVSLSVKGWVELDA